MIVPGVVLGILVGLLRGGKLERLGDLGLKGIPLVFAALLLRFAVGPLEARGFLYAPWLQVIAYLFFLVVVGGNIALPGMKWFGFGSLLNFLVIAANGGTMPVSPKAMAVTGITDLPTGTHALLTVETRLWFLADIIPSWSPMPQIISVGDILIVIGIFLFIQQRMLHREPAAGLVSADE